MFLNVLMFFKNEGFKVLKTKLVLSEWGRKWGLPNS